MSSDEFLESEVLKVEDLRPRSRRVNTTVKVVSKTQVREVTSRRDYSTHRVCEALVGDETSSIYLTLWDDDIDKVDEGNTLKIENGYVKLFRGSMRLNVGRYGSLQVVDETPIEEVNADKNLSEERYQQDRQYPYSGSRRRSYRRQY